MVQFTEFMAFETTQNSQPVVFITGASTGVGLDLVRLLLQKPYRVVATARAESIPRFEQGGLHPSEKLLILPLDITRSVERHWAVEEVKKQWGTVDVLVNNAGISYRAVVEHMNEDEEMRQLNTNYLAPMALIRLVLPLMRAQHSGRILNVSSVSGMMAMPTMSSYSASKFALEGASEALWYEAKPWNIKVSIVEPGFIHSQSFQHIYYSKQSGKSTAEHGVYSEYYESMAPFIEKMMNSARSTSQDVARVILKTIERKHPPLRVPATFDARLFYWLRRLLPRRFYHRILYWGLPGAKNWAKRN